MIARFLKTASVGADSSPFDPGEIRFALNARAMTLAVDSADSGAPALVAEGGEIIDASDASIDGEAMRRVSSRSRMTAARSC